MFQLTRVDITIGCNGAQCGNMKWKSRAQKKRKMGKCGKIITVIGSLNRVENALLNLIYYFNLMKQWWLDIAIAVHRPWGKFKISLPPLLRTPDIRHAIEQQISISYRSLNRNVDHMISYTEWALGLGMYGDGRVARDAGITELMHVIINSSVFVHDGVSRLISSG